MKIIPFLFSSLLAFSVFADEGMWLFNALPLEEIEAKYQVRLDAAWIEQVQKSSLRISAGGSGSFVSSQGLILTNHHVGSKAIYDASKEGKDLMETGFLAQTFQEEISCPNLYVDQLVSIQDVTQEIEGGLSEEMTPAQREEARNSAIILIKNQAKEKTGLQPEVVVLYQGARYHLYLYERYSDIRLVMAPEKRIAFFGGDPDNFEYPRYDLDLCFFRAYRDGKPLVAKHYLPWSEAGAQEGEAVFVAGNPGKTRRMLTSAHLQFLKELEMPLLLQWTKERINDFNTFSELSKENDRIAAQDLFSFENSLKVYIATSEGLSQTPLIENKEKKEALLQENGTKEPWIQLAQALEGARSFYQPYMVLEGIGSSYSRAYVWAKELVRLSKEKELPNGERLKEYADSELPAIELDLFTTEPVYKELEKVRLLGSFKRTIQVLGENHPVTKLILAGKSAEKRVDELIDGTQLFEISERKKLYADLDQVKGSQDPLIQFAQAIDPYAREVRKKKEDELDSVQNESYKEIAAILFKRYGESVYPDATFTLRLSYGAVKGYRERGEKVRPFTTFGGAFKHGKAHEFKDPYDLPQSWLSKEKFLPKNVRFNFISTNDIIGGNSGSPVVNGKGELVGLIFDGNRSSLLWNFGYDDLQGRAVSVHSRGILEALRRVYSADALVEELKVIRKTGR